MTLQGQIIGTIKLLAGLACIAFLVHEVRACQEVSPLESVKCEKVCTTGVKSSTPFDCECLPEKGDPECIDEWEFLAITQRIFEYREQLAECQAQLPETADFEVEAETEIIEDKQ